MKLDKLAFVKWNRVAFAKRSKVVLFLLAVGYAEISLGQIPDAATHSRGFSFPSTIQLSPAPDTAIDNKVASFEAKRQESVNSVLNSGFSNFWIYNLSGKDTRRILDSAQSRGMAIDYMTSGFEIFDRYQPPSISVYAPEYEAEIKRRIDSGLAPLKEIGRLHSVFPFQDEPFHAGPQSFDYSRYAKEVFYERYGYPMPSDLGSVQNDPRKWLDLLNFQSNTFRDGWLKVYRAVKDFDPRPKIVMTHDSHNTFGAGVRSNSRVAIDDVFHWGGDFADIFVYDIYPYMTFDYRYGELGKLPKPRISQMHYTISQMRNLTTAYNKTLGFWVGTYSDKWFDRFRGPERKAQFWSEREMSYTAVAHGADFLISPSNYNTMNLPLDTAHWNNYSEAMKTLQRAGPGLIKAPKVKARACFLFPRTQYLLLQEEYYNVGLTFELFLRSFGELDIIHEDQLIDDKLNGYEVLVLADVKLLPADVAANIVSFVNKGGILIADCVPQMDAFKGQLNKMTGLFGVDRSATGRRLQEGQWVPFVNLPPRMSFPHPDDRKEEPVVKDRLAGNAFDRRFGFSVASPRPCSVKEGEVLLPLGSGHPGLVYHKAGKGKVYLFGFCIQDTYFNTWKERDAAGRRQLGDLIHNVFENAGIRPHIHSSNPDIEAAVRANGKEGYLFVINHEAADPVVSVRLAGLDFRIKRAVDIETGQPVYFKEDKGMIRLDLDVPFGTTRLLKLLP